MSRLSPVLRPFFRHRIPPWRPWRGRPRRPPTPSFTPPRPSFLDGASLPEDLVERATALELPAVALVDANGVYAAPRFHTAAKQAGLKALVGVFLAHFYYREELG
ncbi:MAG: PHP domain-containing protein [Thermoanaerobaculia bacterium]